MDLLKNLNPEQLKAVLHKDGPLLIVAGAGTGKTTAITQRIAYLIEQGLAKPEEVLALTFTEKAAGEMADRAESLLPYGCFDLWISTFHGFAERLIKEHGLSIGLSTDFKLLNSFEQWALVKKNLDKFELDYYRPLGNPTKFIHALIKHFSRAKDEDIDPLQYINFASELQENFDEKLSGASLKRRGNDQFPMTNDQINAQEVARLNEIANAYHVYQQLLLDNNALDFGDLINYCLKLFRERPAILQKYRQQFKYILVDEFQDTNWAQYELIKLLAAPKNNLTVVGDDDQSVYKFRGASLSNILQFKKDFPEAQEIILVKNYRSRQNILDLSYEFIKLNNPNRLEWQLENEKLSKKLIAQEAGVGEIAVIKGADLADEIKLVADKIIELKKSDKAASLNDFAVLVRANDSASGFTSEFDRRGLTYIFGASRGLYAKPVIMDVIAYFKLLDNYHESSAVYRLLNLPMFNFSEAELINFNYLAYKKALSLYEVLNQAEVLKFEAAVIKKIKPVLALIAKHAAAAREKPASEIFLAFMNDSGYLKLLTNIENQKSLEAVSLLSQFFKRLQKFENASDDKSVKAFLAELNLEMEAGEEGALAPDLEAGPEAVKILTAHGAKGLEFKYVFIANLVDKRFPTIERKEAIELPDALVKEILPEGDIHLEEERRLFYVAMTRAKQGLYFSWAPDYGGARDKKPSRFLIECNLVKAQSQKSQIPISNNQTNPKLQIPKQKQIQTQKANTVPTHFSYSQLAAYSSCPYQYRFAHVLKIPTMGKEQFSFGKTMHATLQKLFTLIEEKKGMGQAELFGKTSGPTASAVTLDEILKLYEQSWIEDWYESKQKKEQRKKQGQAILKDFYEKYKDNWPKALFLEKGFNWKIPEGKNAYAVRGVIDRIDQTDGGIRLVDYKTGAPKAKLTFEEKEQLLIYQLAAGELFKQPVAGLAFYYLDNNSEVEFLGTSAELLKVKAKIISTIEEIKQGKFTPKPSQLCKWCDYQGICEYRG